MPRDHAVTTDTAINVDWSEVLDEYGVEFLVLDPHDDRELLNLFRSQPGWVVDFEDEEMALLIRAGSVHAGEEAIFDKGVCSQGVSGQDNGQRHDL
jgi:hypothetical protein